MSNKLHHIHLQNFTTASGAHFKTIPLSYQLFGKKLGTAPVVLVNHALTGNSDVCGENGWWKDLIGKDKTIDTNTYTILAFNIPGNGYDGFIIENYKDFVARDIARLFLLGLQVLKIEQLFAITGGSLGGGIAWEMTILSPKITQHLIPVASDWKATDWMIANCSIQEQFLNNSSKPVHDARMHAMLLYRTPISFNNRFERSENKELGIFNIESWLLHHGKKLQERFQLSAYKLMNQLLKTIDINRNGIDAFNTLSTIESKITIISVDTDLFFTVNEDKKTFLELSKRGKNIRHEIINSIHGHDAFLIELEQLNKILNPVFRS